MLRRGGEGIIDTDKLDLKEDYETPKPLGLDLFRQCGQLTDYQWTLLSGCGAGNCCSDDGGGGGDADSGDNSSDDCGGDSYCGHDVLFIFSDLSGLKNKNPIFEVYSFA